MDSSIYGVVKVDVPINGVVYGFAINVIPDETDGMQIFFNNYGIKVLPILTQGNWYVQATPSAGYFYSTLFYIKEPMLLTGVKYQLQTGGVFTGTSYNGLALYYLTDTTANLVAQTPDDENTWKGLNSVIKTADFTTPYAANPGYYYVSEFYNRSAQSTSPKLWLSANVGGFLNNIAGICIGSVIAGASPPDSFDASDLTKNSGYSFGFTLY